MVLRSGARVAWEGRQEPIDSWLPRQVEVTEWGKLGYETAERSHGASIQPVVEKPEEECRRGNAT